MEKKDVAPVQDLLDRYLKRFNLSPVFDKKEVEHWFIHKGDGERVIWSYVIEVRLFLENFNHCKDYSTNEDYRTLQPRK